MHLQLDTKAQVHMPLRKLEILLCTINSLQNLLHVRCGQYILTKEHFLFKYLLD